jgi:hypothetical protein
MITAAVFVAGIIVGALGAFGALLLSIRAAFSNWLKL